MASDAEKIEQVITWFVQGNSLPLVRESIEGTWPGTDIETLIELARLEIDRQGGWEVAAARYLYSKQVEIGEYADALRTLKEIERLSKARETKEPEPPSTAIVPVLIDPKRTTSDINTYERAIRNGWPIPAETMAQLPEILLQVALTGDARSKIAAIRGLTTMHAQNQKSRPAPTKKVRHIHQIEPVTEHNLNEQKRILLERLDNRGENASGSRTDSGMVE